MDSRFAIFCCSIVALVLILATFQGCSKASERYNERAKLCISQGGSWMQGRDTNDGVCFNMKGAQ